MMYNKKYIIWDWNGTLLNDVEHCVQCINDVLQNHNLDTIGTNTYKQVFTFPVKDYYEAIGFDFDKIDFEKPAMEFINLYYKNFENTELHNDAVLALTFFKRIGFKQFCLSAMEHNELMRSLINKNIKDYFENIKGISDHYARSKLITGELMIKTITDKRNEVIMIGDTIHDYEVAKNLGIDCLLVSGGHQSADRLKEVTEHVYPDLKSITDLFKQ